MKPRRAWSRTHPFLYLYPIGKEISVAISFVAPFPVGCYDITNLRPVERSANCVTRKQTSLLNGAFLVVKRPRRGEAVSGTAAVIALGVADARCLDVGCVRGGGGVRCWSGQGPWSGSRGMVVVVRLLRLESGSEMVVGGGGGGGGGTVGRKVD